MTGQRPIHHYVCDFMGALHFGLPGSDEFEAL
jgi:hypothetical protein